MTTKNFDSNKQSFKSNKAILAGKKANGTLLKVIKMIEEDKYCPDIIQQVDAVIGLLKSTKKNLLEGHLNHCLEHKLHEDREKTIEELLQIYTLNQK
jgi:CsoR family transcriptional regulator, copper-sensing transcriptional repressor